ncbi:MAG: hypothetical protein M0C28_33120 [Candidatus Moduliflexus flocculans]|nr:hypothetical protein [Candidatus Moduliflexus flocculans]
MTSNTPRLAAVLLTALFVITLTTAAAQAKKWDALLGTWDIKTEDGAREFVFEFTLKDDKLAGKFSGASGTSEMANLTFEDNTVKFSVTVGNGMVIDFSAIVAEDKLSGMLSLQYGEAAITGTRRK